MKYLAALIVAILCLGAFAKATQEQQRQMNELGDAEIGVPRRCEYHCTTADTPVCSTNVQCTHQFQSLCHLSAYNCKRPQKPFFPMEQWRCEVNWAPRCNAQELGL